jgi:hypothetical protein
VSLLSPDTLSLYITPQRIQAVKTVGLGQRPVEVHQRNAVVQAADNWQDLVRVANDLVRKTQAQRLHVVLSDELVRYACFDWHPELRSAEEDMAMAVLNFDDVYGANASADWHFAFSAGRPGQSRLSVATPRSLFAVLQNHLGQPHPKIQSVRTAFTATLQTHRKRLGESGWLINLEEGRLTLGSWSLGVWKWIYSAHTDIATPEALLERVRQEIRLASTSLKPTQLLHIGVHAPAFEHLPFGQIEGVHFLPLKTARKEPGSKYAFALMGAAA